MNRRSFLGWLAGASLVPSAIVRAITSAPADIYKCIIKFNVRRYTMRSLPVPSRHLIIHNFSDVVPLAPVSGMILAPWFQTARTMHCSTLDYEDKVDATMSPRGDPGIRLRWHERRKERSRERMAELRKQQPLPLP